MKKQTETMPRFGKHFSQEIKVKLTPPKPDKRLIPNLSLKGKDIKTRLNNRSLIVNTTGQQYGSEKELDDLRRMSGADILREMAATGQRIEALKNIITNEMAKPKAAPVQNTANNG